MAGGDELVGSSGFGGPLAAVLIIGAGTNVYDAFSAVMSSPWSTEKFTNSPEEEQMAREYVRHAMLISWGYCFAGAGVIMLDPGTPNAVALAPIMGGLGATVYMYWLYNRALGRSLNGGMSAAPGGGAPAGGGEQSQGQVVPFPVPDSAAYPWAA